MSELSEIVKAMQECKIRPSFLTLVHEFLFRNIVVVTNAYKRGEVRLKMELTGELRERIAKFRENTEELKTHPGFKIQRQSMRKALDELQKSLPGVVRIGLEGPCLFIHFEI